MMKYTIVILLFFCHVLYGQHSDNRVRKIPHQKEAIEFVKNKGQWEDHIQFQSDIPSGNLYLESGKLTYVFYSQEDIERIHDIRHGPKENITENDMIIDAHLYQVEFLGSNPNQKFIGKRKKSNYVNYYLGKQKEYWASKVPVYNEAFVRDMYDNIDYRIYSQDIDLKYDFIVKEGGDPSEIKMKFLYLDKLKEKYGNLYLETSVNSLIDLKPFAFQEYDDGPKKVECNYVLKGDELSFEFPNGYDKSRRLIVDPQLIFSSYSGASKDNWGFTATFDENGNLYGGGVVFSHATRSYPTTTGAFQVNAGGGGIDIGITKFNSSGTSLIYSTYLGGTRNEIPHSMVVNSVGQLIVMGTTSSVDFPVTSSAYDTTFNRIGSATLNIASATFLGSDIILTKFSASGDTIIGSTYIGGSSFDGFNTNNLEYNYGDDVRGEVVVDNQDFTYVATTTASNNFPVTNTSNFRGGNQEAVVFKMDSAFSNLVYSTYIGGSGNDAAYSVQVDNSGFAHVAGGTNSGNFPTTLGTINPSSLGNTDGFVCVLNNAGSIVRSTRFGTSSYDQVYFVQLDDKNNVYVTGQTEGVYATTPSTVYKNTFSGQFIHKVTPGLDTTVFSTVIGTGGSSSNVAVDISPSAFLVNQCNHIYLSGWGGDINSTYSQATSSTTTGLPTTPGAHKTTTDGNDFYLIVLDEDADSLLYATFFGGTSGQLRGEHVDGGTSRFDKKGIVYQAVCAGCGGSNSFPTAPTNVWAPSNNSYNCNLGVIKFDLSQLTSDIAMSAITKVCIPGTVTFQNNSNGGNQYFWDFGDGNTSNQFQPTHTYIDTGDFTVKLVVWDSLSCILQDTAEIIIRGEAPPIASADTVGVICPGDSVMLRAYGGVKFQWNPSGSLSNDTIWNPLASPVSNTTYTVIVGDSCGSDTSNYFAYDTATVVVLLAQNNTSASPDDTICLGESIELNASGGVSYVWTPPTYLNKSNVSNPISTPPLDITYKVRITDQYSCPWTRWVKIRVEDPENPQIYSHPDTILCLGDSVELFSIGGQDYSWTPAQFASTPNNDTTWVTPNENTVFLIEIGSKCFTTYDTIRVAVRDFVTEAMPDTFACADVPIKLFAAPGEKLTWTPKSRLDSNSVNAKYPMATITEETLFYVEAEDSLGCIAFDSVLVSLRDDPFVSAGGDQLINQPTTRLEGKGKGSFKWDPEEFLDCPECPNTGVMVPVGSHMFTLTLTDEFGCVAIDDVVVTRLENDLFVPNSFTPNSDSKNDVFKPIGFEIQEYRLTIYNRWGQIIFVTTDFDTGWDGTFDGQESGNGVYVYEIDYVQNDKEKAKRGTVSLVR